MRISPRSYIGLGILFIPLLSCAGANAIRYFFRSPELFANDVLLNVALSILMYPVYLPLAIICIILVRQLPLLLSHLLVLAMPQIFAIGFGMLAGQRLTTVLMELSAAKHLFPDGQGLVAMAFYVGMVNVTLFYILWVLLYKFIQPRPAVVVDSPPEESGDAKVPAKK